MAPKHNPVETSPADAAPHYHGHRERLRARFMEAGAQALADYEMLELVLFRAVPRRDVKPLAKDLLLKFGSFAEVISAPAERLKQEGLGEAAIIELKVVQAAAQRLARGEVKKRTAMSSGTAVIDYARAAHTTRTDDCGLLFEGPGMTLALASPIALRIEPNGGAVGEMTRQVASVAKPLGIQVLDHVIVGKDGHASLKGLKLI